MNKSYSEKKKCHQCSKTLKRPFENFFNHCYECGLKRLDKLTPSFEPCQICAKGDDQT